MNVEIETRPLSKQERIPGGRMQEVLEAIYLLNDDRTDSKFPDEEARTRYAFADLIDKGVGSGRTMDDVLRTYRIRYKSNFINPLLHFLELGDRPSDEAAGSPGKTHPNKARFINFIQELLRNQGINPEGISTDDLISLARNEDGFSFKDILAREEIK